jgi:hypothetical protein
MTDEKPDKKKEIIGLGLGELTLLILLGLGRYFAIKRIKAK